MFKKIFKKEKKIDVDKNILIAALLVHAAKIDENYTDSEREIIKKALIALNKITIDDAETLLLKAEEKEQESNQIVEFTREIKKYSNEFKKILLFNRDFCCLLWDVSVVPNYIIFFGDAK